MSEPKQPRTTVLVVEDDVTLASMACDMVEESGFTPFACDSGHVAYAYMEKHADQVAALFVDVVLRDSIDGIALAITTNADHPWVRICVTSGKTETRPPELPAAVTYLPKPWRALEVLEFVLRG